MKLPLRPRPSICAVRGSSGYARCWVELMPGSRLGTCSNLINPITCPHDKRYFVAEASMAAHLGAAERSRDWL